MRPSGTSRGPPGLAARAGDTITFVATPMAERMMALPWPALTSLRVMLTGADALHAYPPPGCPSSW